jgi:hypothetical protein
MSYESLATAFVNHDRLPFTIKFGLLVAVIIWHGLILFYIFYISPTSGKWWPNRVSVSDSADSADDAPPGTDESTYRY